MSLVSVAQLVGAFSHTPEGWGFNIQSGHIPRLQVQSPVGVYMGGNQSMFLTSMFFLSLPSSFFKINEHVKIFNELLLYGRQFTRHYGIKHKQDPALPSKVLQAFAGRSSLLSDFCIPGTKADGVGVTGLCISNSKNSFKGPKF